MSLFLKNLLFTVLVPGTVAGYLPWLIVRREVQVPSGWTFLAGAFFLVGGATYLWCVWHFANFGRGTPAPIDAPKKLVTRGLYGFIRNPMYVGVLMVILGWAALFQSSKVLTYAIGVGTFFHLFVVFYEEPHLASAFGTEYARYRSQVGRWIPRIWRVRSKDS